MKKLIGIVVLSAVLAPAAFGAPKKVEETPLTNEQLVERFIQCSAIMHMNAEKYKEEPQLAKDARDSAGRHGRAAAYFLRGQMDVDNITAFIQNGILTSRLSLEQEVKADPNAMDKRLGECTTAQVMAKGFEAFQALGPNAANSFDSLPAQPVVAFPLQKATPAPETTQTVVTTTTVTTQTEASVAPVTRKIEPAPVAIATPVPLTDHTATSRIRLERR
jgi:hypothetical protein